MNNHAPLSYDLLLLNITRAVFAEDTTTGEPLGLYILSAFAEENGYPARVFVGDITNIEQVLFHEINHHHVKIIGFYCDYDNQFEVSTISAYIKENYPKIAVIVGGPQAIALDLNFLQESKCDAVVRGEGELPLLQLLQFFVDGVGQLEKISSLTYLDTNNSVQQTPLAPPIKNLDVLPFPQKDHALSGQFRNNYSVMILTGRGCPFSCTYCYEGYRSRSVRYRSVENVFQEIDEVLKHTPDLKYILFVDDTFTLDKKRLAMLCDGLKKRRETYNFRWYCEGHINVLAKFPEMIPMMVEAGLHRLQLGVETGVQHVLDAYKKKISLEQIKEVIRQCVIHKVPQVVTNFILGGAHETRDTILSSLSFAKELILIAPGILDIHSVYFCPYPDTPMTRFPEQYDIKIMDPLSYTSTISLSGHCLVETKTLSKFDIIQLKKQFDAEIEQHMYACIENQIVSIDILLMQIQAYEYYHVQNLWCYIIQKHEIIGKYISFLYKKVGCQSVADEIVRLKYKVIRTISPDFFLAEKNGKYCFKDEDELTPLKFQLLEYCTGKLTLEKIVEKLFVVYQDLYQIKDFQQLIFKILAEFEKKFLIVYSKL